VQSGDLEGYRKVCLEIESRFRDTKHPNVAERMAKACLILPDSGVDPELIAAWSELATTSGKDLQDLPWFQFARALSDYRRGHYDEASNLARTVLNQPGRQEDRELEAMSVLAMAQQRNGDRQSARMTLARARELESRVPKLEGATRGNWHDWIIAQVLLREAGALIGESSDH
jgi:hypothetical protein